MSKTLVEFALDYAQRGWHVFPCRPDNKAPYIPSDKDANGEPIPKTGGLYKATRDPDVIRDWWTRWPHAMIGVRLGEQSGVWAIDPDAPDKPGKPDGRANWTRLQVKNGRCPHTHTHLTPGGGQHLLFKWRPDRPITNSEGKLKGLGINVRGNGGYVIAPPSQRHDGKTYEIAEPLDFFNFAEAPEWLYELILTKPQPSNSERALALVRTPTSRDASAYVEAAVRNECAILESTGSGGRNNQLNTSAFSLGTLVGAGELPERDAEHALYQAAVVNGHVADKGSHKTNATIRSGLKAGIKRPRKIPDLRVAEPSRAAQKNDIVTEDSAAQDFVDLYEDELRYDHTIKNWYRWTGQYWCRDDKALAFHWSRQLARHLAREQDARARYITSKVSFAASVEKFARTDPRVAVTRDYWDPDKYLLGTPEGTLDLRTGKLRPAGSSDLITRQAAVAPADTADCPHFMEFLRQATNGDADLITFLQQFCGYCLTGDTKEQALLFIHGDGGNGKGVLQRVLGSIMGTYTSVATMDTFMASNFDKHSTDLASLADARLVMASETEEGRAWAEAKIKQITGGDKIKARFMRQDNFEFMPEFKLFLIGNNQPNLKQVNNAVRRRFNIVPFIYKPEKVDFDLEEVKLRPEWPAILRWFIDGCLMWQRTGLQQPQVVIDANEEYFGEQDLLQQWLDECCDLRATIWDTSKNLFSSWSDWMTERGENPGSQKSLTQSLKKRPGISKSDNEKARGLKGIRVKPELHQKGE